MNGDLCIGRQRPGTIVHCGSIWCFENGCPPAPQGIVRFSITELERMQWAVRHLTWRLDQYFYDRTVDRFDDVVEYI